MKWLWGRGNDLVAVRTSSEVRGEDSVVCGWGSVVRFSTTNPQSTHKTPLAVSGKYATGWRVLGSWGAVW